MIAGLPGKNLFTKGFPLIYLPFEVQTTSFKVHPISLVQDGV